MVTPRLAEARCDWPPSSMLRHSSSAQHLPEFGREQRATRSRIRSVNGRPASNLYTMASSGMDDPSSGSTLGTFRMQRVRSFQDSSALLHRCGSKGGPLLAKAMTMPAVRRITTPQQRIVFRAPRDQAIPKFCLIPGLDGGIRPENPGKRMPRSEPSCLPFVLSYSGSGIWFCIWR